MNIGAAIAHLTYAAGPKSQGACARFVRQAIEAGGQSTAGRPVSAYQYKWYLPTIGYQLIGTIAGRQAQAEWTRAQAQPGDISVMDHGKHGHICMWNGRNWISDFVQNNMWVYQGDGVCYIFRYTGEISNEPFAIPMFPGGMTGFTQSSIGDCPEDIKFKKLWRLYQLKAARVG